VIEFEVCEFLLTELDLFHPVAGTQKLKPLFGLAPSCPWQRIYLTASWHAKPVAKDTRDLAGLSRDRPSSHTKTINFRWLQYSTVRRADFLTRVLSPAGSVTSNSQTSLKRLTDASVFNQHRKAAADKMA
jgi:hypothetical protein